MRSYLLLLCCALTISASYAQQKTSADTLIFNQKVSHLANQWVVFPKTPNTGKYAYGYVYVDAMAGFTFQLTGNFTITNGSYAVDTALRKKLQYGSMKYRLGANTKLVSVLPQSRYGDLGIKGEPDWVKSYNSYTDTLAHNVIMGRHLNTLNDCEYALAYLLKTYTVKPHSPGLEFELAYAYNVLKRFNDAANVLVPAIKNNPDDIFMYKELGYAYSGKGDLDKSIAAYKDGIDHCGNTHPNEKLEMCFNLTMAYRSQKNDALYKEWGQKTKEMAPVNSPVYKQLVLLGF